MTSSLPRQPLPIFADRFGTQIATEPVGGTDERAKIAQFARDWALVVVDDPEGLAIEGPANVVYAALVEWFGIWPDTDEDWPEPLPEQPYKV